MEQPFETPVNPTPKPKKGPSVMKKIIVITVLILGMLIPLGFIQGTIVERQGYKNSVVQEIASTWAQPQTFIGPVLVIPYLRREVTMVDGKTQDVTVRDLAFLLPDHYRFDGKLKPEERYRGIYKHTVYQSDIDIQGDFSLTPLSALHVPKERMLWEQAFLLINLTDAKGIQKSPELTWNGKSLEMLPIDTPIPFSSTDTGVAVVNVPISELTAPTPLNPAMNRIPFKMKIGLKGSESLQVSPVGKQSRIQMASSWESPEFIGQMLPSTRDVSEKGFNATWDIPYFARNYPQAFVRSDNALPKLAGFNVGTSLLIPVDFYQQSERAVKYGILFLVLTFSTYFLFEVIAKHRFHPFQYLLVGCGLCLFYLLLLALSEVIGFLWAYIAGSLSIITLITLYTGAILRKAQKQLHHIIAFLLATLYTYLYVLLQLEDLSLLFGTIGLFLVLALIMYITRNIDWYEDTSCPT
jgi:inner membrane protein